VCATRLGSALSVTFVDDGEGWRFERWTTLADRVPAIQPQDIDRYRRFADISEALLYFRQHYRDVAGC
jgi:hypothetical protein